MASDQSLLMIAWSRIWSPVVEEALRSSAWQALELPDTYENHKADYWSLFHVGNPEPKVSLIMHSGLRQEGSSVREDWLRVISHLGLTWDAVNLPPDQLGAACEIYACAIEREEPVLIQELRERYLLPWCRFALQELTEINSPLSALAESFAEDLLAITID